jgi:hypothetical protein
MARVKLIVRKHIHTPPRRNIVPTESHSDSQNAEYFPRTLWTVLLALGYSELPLFIGVPRLLRGNSYLWRVRVMHEEQSSQKITELEALCKRLREDTHKVREEKTTLEGMIQSRDELVLEMAEEYGLNRMGENNGDEDDDDDDEGNIIAAPALAPAVVPEEIVEEDTVKNDPQELDDFDDLGDLDEDPNEGCSDVEDWFPQDGSNDRD